MLSFHLAHWPQLLLTGLVLAALPAAALGEPPSGVFSYRHGYNPGYKGASAHPLDSGAKPGQIYFAKHSLYRYVSSSVGPPAPAPKKWYRITFTIPAPQANK
jgi:hypothetical protein